MRPPLSNRPRARARAGVERSTLPLTSLCMCPTRGEGKSEFGACRTRDFRFVCIIQRAWHESTPLGLYIICGERILRVS